MTAHYIATIVDKCFNAIDFDAIMEKWKDIPRREACGRTSDDWVNRRINDPAYEKWNRACSLLHQYIKWNIDTFEETELVYYWAKPLCDHITSAKNHFNGWEWWKYKSFPDFYFNKR